VQTTPPTYKGNIMAGAPKGNQNSTSEKRVWSKIVRKLAVQEDYAKLHRVANALYEKAAEGDVSAIKELGDRLDGKAMQENMVTGDADNPLTINVVTGIDDGET
tara:strand:- start:391 stop:702 length:312 start_codon:yes stop_codon:yes gene_type:complete